jgi:hypothetical protein
MDSEVGGEVFPKPSPREAITKPFLNPNIYLIFALILWRSIIKPY